MGGLLQDPLARKILFLYWLLILLVLIFGLSAAWLSMKGSRALKPVADSPS